MLVENKVPDCRYNYSTATSRLIKKNHPQDYSLRDEILWSWYQPGSAESDALDLEVDLTPEGVRRCRSEVWLSRWIELHEDGSGTIRTKMSASYTPWTVHFFLGFGMEANVKHPQVVREQIQSKLRELLKQYEH